MKDNLVQLVQRPSNDNDYLHAAWAMEKGGSFAAAIGDAYIAADPQNRARLRAAFPDLFTQFFNLYLQRNDARRSTVKIYKVELSRTSYFYTHVEAESPEDAKDKAWDDLMRDQSGGTIEDAAWDIQSVEEVPEDEA